MERLLGQALEENGVSPLVRDSSKSLKKGLQKAEPKRLALR